MKSPYVYCEIEVGIFFLFILLFPFVLLFLGFSVFLR